MIVMSIKVGENPPIEVARRFNDAGHDALSVLDQEMGGASDKAIARDGSNTINFYLCLAISPIHALERDMRRKPIRHLT